VSEKEQIEFKKWYITIFSINYLFQGVVQSIFAVIVPIYLLIMIKSTGLAITAGDIALIASIILLPWAVKLFFGILSDKYGLKKIGRRRPWIIPPVIMAGCVWILLPFIITPENAITIFIIVGIIIMTGIAISDTALDGLILDICPKEQLGRAQGTCWGFRSVGAIAGGPLFVYLMLFLNTSVEMIFVIVGILMILSSLTMIVINEPKRYPKVILSEHFVGMFKTKKDWKMYFFSLFNAVIDGVVIIFLSIYLLIQLGIIGSKGAALSLETTDINVYIVQANLNIIISIGIILGAIIGGIVSDRATRKISVYISYILTTLALLAMILQFHVFLLLIIASLVGAGMGWRHSSYSAVAGEMSKRHPEMDSTYLSICNSFSNLGGSLGLALTGLLFGIAGSYIFIFLFLALIQNIGILPFFLLNPMDYEYKLDKSELI